ITFFLTLEEMTADLARTEPKVALLLAQGQTIGGAYQGKTGRLYLDGGDEETEGRDIVSLYAHEFSHAVNGPGRSVSNSKAWEEAWESELRTHPPTKLSRVDRHEGFAEFGKVLYTGKVTRRDLERDYPRCVQVWRER